MTQPTEYSFTRYLDAKRAIDDRSLNVHVWNALTAVIDNRSTTGVPLRVLEMGAGTGSMIERLARGGILSAAHYTAIDASADSVQAGIARLHSWASENVLRCEAERTDGNRMKIWGQIGANPTDIQIDWVCADLFDWFAAVRDPQPFDLVVAHAFLDLVDTPRVLDLLAGATRPGSLCYFTLNFDGATILLPEYGGDVDDRIERFYHASMDSRQVNGQPSGDSRTGRRLFTWMRNAAIDILAAGSSDWVIHADRGRYPGDTAYFLHHILHFFETSLATAPGLDPALLAQWLQTRRDQIDRGELVYIAHQMDLLGAWK